MATPQQAQGMVTYFSNKYKKKYGEPPVLNRYSARWGFDSILMDMSEKQITELIDYYFETSSPNKHTLEWFFYNHEKLVNAKRTKEQDAALQKQLRDASKKRTEEWKRKNNIA